MDYAINTNPKKLHSVNNIILALKKDRKESFVKIEKYLAELRNKDWYKEVKIGGYDVVFVNTKSNRQFFVRADVQQQGIVDLLVSDNVKDDIIKTLAI